MYLLNIYYNIKRFIIKSFYYLYYLLSLIEIPAVELTTIYLIITLFLLTIFFYIKIRFPFWNVQPVFHSYDFWRYYTRTPFVIQKSYPLKTKFCKFENVLSLTQSEISNENITKCVDILQCHYISSDRVLFTIDSKTLQSLLLGNDGSPLLSFYLEKKYLIVDDLSNNSNSQIVIEKNPIGVMVSRPVHFYFISSLSKLSNNETSYTHILGNVWDFICINREHKNKKLSRNLIQTHEYNQRLKYPDSPISIFKKETELCEGIVPLTKYKTYTYYLRNIQLEKLPEHFIITRIQKENQDILFDFLTGLSNSSSPKFFTFCAIPNISNLISIINNNDLYVYCLRRGQHVYGIYFIKDNHINYEDFENGNALQLIASIDNSNSPELFGLGFMQTIRSIFRLKKKKFQLMLIEETSHNIRLLREWNKKFSPILENDTAYYLYNFVFPGSPISSESCLFLL